MQRRGDSTNDSTTSVDEPTDDSAIQGEQRGEGRLSPEDKALLRATARMWPLLILGPLLTLLSVRFLLTVDGAEYVELAQTLKAGDILADWNFVRDPGLPFLVRYTLLTPLAVPGYLLVSGLLVSLSVAFMGGVFYDVGKSWQRLVAGVIALTGSVFLTYAGAVMQQPGMAFLLALLGLNLRLIQTGRGLRPVRFVSLGLVSVVAIYFSFVFLPIILIAAVIATGLGLSRSVRKGIGASALALILGVLVVALPVVAYQYWEGLREQGHSTYPSSSGSALTGNFVDRASTSFSEQGLATAVLLRWQTARTLLQLPTPDSTASEDMNWATISFPDPDNGRPECGHFVVFEPERIVRFKTLVEADYCQPVDGTQIWGSSTLASLSYQIGGLSSLGLIVGTLWAVVKRRRLLAVLALPWAWLGMYAQFLQIDRYSMPVWPYKVVFSLTLLLAGVSWVTTSIVSRCDRADRWHTWVLRHRGSIAWALWGLGTSLLLSTFWVRRVSGTWSVPGVVPADGAAPDWLSRVGSATGVLLLALVGAILAWIVASALLRAAKPWPTLLGLAALTITDTALLRWSGSELGWATLACLSLLFALGQLALPVVLTPALRSVSRRILLSVPVGLACWAAVIMVATVFLSNDNQTAVIDVLGQLWVVLLALAIASAGVAGTALRVQLLRGPVSAGLPREAVA